ncbi:hypothetical protein VB773_10210 [Haloarculaceae archaeon H-GB2-1]|nr:hypothetical protein [Haloarculaceae archaeon H-GB2-1]
MSDDESGGTGSRRSRSDGEREPEPTESPLSDRRRILVVVLALLVGLFGAGAAQFAFGDDQQSSGLRDAVDDVFGSDAGNVTNRTPTAPPGSVGPATRTQPVATATETGQRDGGGQQSQTATTTLTPTTTTRASGGQSTATSTTTEAPTPTPTPDDGDSIFDIFPGGGGATGVTRMANPASRPRVGATTARVDLR